MAGKRADDGAGGASAAEDSPWYDAAWTDETREMMIELCDRLQNPLPAAHCFDELRQRAMPAAVELGSLAVAVGVAAAARDQGPAIGWQFDLPGPRD